MDTVVVNDTNIFIDLCSIDLLDEFFALSFDIHTTDFVVSELIMPEQQTKIIAFYESKRLYVKKYTAKEIAKVVSFQMECDNNVSIVDCSVCLYAKQNNYRLITGDNKLRRLAITSGAAVSGILYVFDQLVEQGIITPQEGYEKLKNLSEINNRLPSKEIDKRLKLWNSKI